jgi:hypothetical protein
VLCPWSAAGACQCPCACPLPLAACLVCRVALSRQPVANGSRCFGSAAGQGKGKEGSSASSPQTSNGGAHSPHVTVWPRAHHPGVWARADGGPLPLCLPRPSRPFFQTAAAANAQVDPNNDTPLRHCMRVENTKNGSVGCACTAPIAASAAHRQSVPCRRCPSCGGIADVHPVCLC